MSTASHLLIGEAAQLLGVSAKALRNYEKHGLIEPARSEAGYRLYAPADVLRLQRIRQLQALGLSLRQIRAILGEPGSAEEWRRVLSQLRDDIRAEIAALEDRQAQVEDLLDADLPDALDGSAAPEPTLARILAALARTLPAIDPEVLERERTVLASIAGRHPADAAGGSVMPGGGGAPWGVLPVGYAAVYRTEPALLDLLRRLAEVLDVAVSPPAVIAPGHSRRNDFEPHA